jgi:hypothetical protein
VRINVQVRLDRSAEPRIRAAAAEALGDITEAALADANQTCPVETGTLRRSGFAEVDEQNLVGQVAYDTPYAVIQHEDPHFHHDPPTRDHWLERSVAENQRRYAEVMAERLRRASA